MAPADDELCYLTASEALERFRRRALSPVELLDAQIARIEAVNPRVNALTHCSFDRARAEARRAEQVWASRGAAPRPLEGVPIAIKDFHAVAGEITTFGSRAYEHFRPDSTAPTVERLLEAGAIMHCRTTTPEFAYGDACHSPLWGITRNPYNLAFGPGGSSGGAGAALAAGMTTLADGTDGGGSIRIPASCCGLVGYKPPYGRNPVDRDHPMESLLVYGPLARSVADAALMQNVMSGPHPDDAASLREALVLPDPSAMGDVRGWRLAFSMDLGYVEVDPEVQALTRAALEGFRELGCSVDEVAVGWSWQVYDTWITHWESLFAAATADLLPRWRVELDPFVVELVERGLAHRAADAYRRVAYRGEMYRRLAPILEGYDALLVPTTGLPSVPADHDDHGMRLTINGRPVPSYVGWVLTHGMNLVGYCPVMSVPSGVSASGVPTGLQIVARSFDDRRVFQLAAAFEAARPWRARRPRL